MVLCNEDYSESEISVKVGCSQTSVHTAIVNSQTCGTFSDKERREQTRKISSRDDH